MENRTNLYMLLGSMLLHGAMMALNELLFRRTEFLQGIGWIYIPAGTRLLCTLLFGEAGAFGLLFTSWIACYCYYFPGDVVRATSGAVASALGPYLIYRLARQEYRLHASLSNLTPKRLLICAFASAIASPALHHIWFAIHNDGHLLSGFFVMCVGDLAGSLIVLYCARILLSIMPSTSGADSGR